MSYLLLAVVVAFVTAAMTKELPRTRTRIGVVSLAVAVVSVTIAELTGNLGLYYLGTFAVAFGVLVLLIRVVGAAFDRGDSQVQL